MGFSSTACFRNEVGKVLGKLRVDFGETVAKQSKRLGFNPAYVSLVSSGDRGFSYEFYKRTLNVTAKKRRNITRFLQRNL